MTTPHHERASRVRGRCGCQRSGCRLAPRAAQPARRCNGSPRPQAESCCYQLWMTLPRARFTTRRSWTVVCGAIIRNWRPATLSRVISTSNSLTEIRCSASSAASSSRSTRLDTWSRRCQASRGSGAQRHPGRHQPCADPSHVKARLRHPHLRRSEARHGYQRSFPAHGLHAGEVRRCDPATRRGRVIRGATPVAGGSRLRLASN
jgi:hypothetical protein